MMKHQTEVQTVEFSSGKQLLGGTLYRSPEGSSRRKGVIFIHGWRSNQQSPVDYAMRLAEQGYNGLAFDLRGHNKSEGDFASLSRQDFLEDSIAAYDFLHKKCEIDETYAIGSSFGAYLACLLTLERSIAGLVLRVPASYPDEGFDKAQKTVSDAIDKYGWRARKEPLADTRAHRALRSFAGRVLVVASGKDEIIHPNIVASYNDAVSLEELSYVVMENAPHAIGKNEKLRRQYGDILLHWFSAKS